MGSTLNFSYTMSLGKCVVLSSEPSRYEYSPIGKEGSTVGPMFFVHLAYLSEDARLRIVDFGTTGLNLAPRDQDSVVVENGCSGIVPVEARRDSN